MCCVGIVSIHGFGTGRARRLGGGSRFSPLPVVHDEDDDVRNDPRTHAHTHTCTHPTRTRKGTHARSYPPMRHTRAYTCAHARMRAHTHARAHTHPNVLTHALKHPSIHPSIHAPTQPSMHVWLPVRAYTCVCVGMCIHSSVHTPVCSYQGSDSAYILNRRSHDSM